MADILDYLERAGRRRFAWGELDCWLFVADWIRLSTGVDPAANFRGRYSTTREARRIMRENGGPVALSDRLLETVGASSTLRPDEGDVALVSAPLVLRRRRIVLVPVGAICLGVNRWAIKLTGAGLEINNFRVVRAWSLPRA